MTVLLASYPRSGNTWMRLMLEHVTGRPVDSAHSDSTPGRPEGVKGDPIALKTHFLSQQPFKKAIWLIRHPYDAIRSYWLYRQDFDDMRDWPWEEHVAWEIPRYLASAVYWNAFQSRLCIRYEDMLKDPHTVLSDTLDYIGWEYKAVQIVKAVEETTAEKMRKITQPNFMREARSGYGAECFTERMRSRAQRVLKLVGERHGYEL